MTRIVVLAATTAALIALVPASASAQGFTLGVSASEVTSSSALLWARAPKTGQARLQVALDRRFRKRRLTKTLFVRGNNDRTVQTRVAGLAPSRRYWYFFHQGRQRSAVGTFVTAPRPNAFQTIEFGVTGDTEGHKDENGNLYWNRRGARDMAIYSRMAAEGNHFNINLGDVIYSDPTGALRPRLQTALTLAEKRATYRENLGYKAYQRIRRTGTVYNQWDDHEFINDFTPGSQACDIGTIGSTGGFACDVKGIHRAGIEAFREYMPVTYSPANGTYRSFRWGRNLEIFILDERSFRSIHASEVKVDPNAPEPGADHVCDNPMGSKNADPAPQAPQRLRDVFAFLYPPAANPVPQACLDALNDPSRTFLGKRQYDSFTAAIRRSTARWKVVINEMPILAHYFNPWDGWQGYSAERTKLLEFLKANVKNVVFLSTDFHANWVNEARVKTFPEEGGPEDTGIWDFVSAGVATHLFADELDEFTGNTGSYRLLEDAFLKQAPPNGPGMKCANGNRFSYAQVTVRAKSLTVTLKDVDGKTIVEEGDNPRTCKFDLTLR